MMKDSIMNDNNGKRKEINTNIFDLELWKIGNWLWVKLDNLDITNNSYCHSIQNL